MRTGWSSKSKSGTTEIKWKNFFSSCTGINEEITSGDTCFKFTSTDIDCDIARAQAGRVMVVRYEDVQADPGHWVRAVAAHYGFALSAGALAAGLALSFVVIGLFVATLGFAAGLDQDVFDVSEDKVRQKIISFGSEDAPLSVGIVFDTSGSMGPKLEKSLRRGARVVSHDYKVPGWEATVVDRIEAVYREAVGRHRASLTGHSAA